MSVSDRDYMRDAPRRPLMGRVKGLSAYAWIMIAITVVFLLQFTSDTLYPIILDGGVSVQRLAAGHFWTLVTYMFVHGSAGHFLLNALMLWFVVGRCRTCLAEGTFCRFSSSAASSAPRWRCW